MDRLLLHEIDVIERNVYIRMLFSDFANSNIGSGGKWLVTSKEKKENITIEWDSWTDLYSNTTSIVSGMPPRIGDKVLLTDIGINYNNGLSPFDIYCYEVIADVSKPWNYNPHFNMKLINKDQVIFNQEKQIFEYYKREKGKFFSFLSFKKKKEELSYPRITRLDEIVEERRKYKVGVIVGFSDKIITKYDPGNKFATKITEIKGHYPDGVLLKIDCAGTIMSYEAKILPVGTKTKRC